MIYKNVKRSIDVVLSIIGLIILAPLLLTVSLAIKIESKGPIIFKQQRLGLNGKAFNIYKFRSMYLDSEKLGVYETKNDKRVTKVGKIIRRTSIDELPQLINIIKGDMSIIGPRPTLTYHPYSFEEYSEKQKRRFDIRPGVTGWAQINGRKEIDWIDRIKYDVYYVEKMSFLFDVKIFLKTILKVFLMEDNINTKFKDNKGND